MKNFCRNILEYMVSLEKLGIFYFSRMNDDWDSDGDNSKRSRPFNSRQYSNQTRYNDNRQSDGRDGNRRGGYGRGNSRGERSSQYGQRNQYDQSNQYNQSSTGEEITLQIQTNRIGKLIGRGGSQVKEFQSDSGCRIVVRIE